MTFVARSYQVPAIEWISRRRRGLIRAKAGAGKTNIAAAAIAKVVNSKTRTIPVRIGWVAPTVETCDQARAALSKFPMNATTRVVCAAGAPDMSDCDVLVVDEAQHSLSPSWLAVIASCTGAVWGFTATPCMDDPEKHAALLELFGGEMFTVDPEEVAKTLAGGRVRMLDDTDEGLQQSIDDEIEERLTKMIRRMTRGRPGRHEQLREEWWPRVAYRVCLDLGIQENEKRNAAIVRLAKIHAKDSTLILVNNKEHGAALAKDIPDSMAAHSKMKKRAEAISRFRDGDLRCVIATSMLDEGADFPRANVLLYACGGKAAGRVEQRTGRVLRAFQGKQEGLIYDFVDEQHPLMANQSRKRQAVYRELGYVIEPVRDRRQPEMFARF